MKRQMASAVTAGAIDTDTINRGLAALADEVRSLRRRQDGRARTNDRGSDTDDGDDGGDQLVSLRQTSALLGLSEPTIWRLRRRGDFPIPVQLSPGRLAFKRAELIAWMDSRRGDPVVDAQ